MGAFSGSFNYPEVGYEAGLSAAQTPGGLNSHIVLVVGNALPNPHGLGGS